MKLTALEIVRIIVALENCEEFPADWVEDLQVKIIKEILPKELDFASFVKDQVYK